MKIRTRNMLGDFIDHELDDRALEHTAQVFGIRPLAVAIIIKTYDDVCTERPDRKPATEIGRRLEVSGDWAIEVFTEFICFELEGWS